MPGLSSATINQDLENILETHGLHQHVREPTHRSTNVDRENILDLVVAHTSSSVVSNVAVVASHHLSDHKLIIGPLQVKRTKLPSTTYKYRNIKLIDVDDFWRRILSSSLFDQLDYSVDAYLDLMEQVVVNALDAEAHFGLESGLKGKEAVSGCRQMLSVPSRIDDDSSADGNQPEMNRIDYGTETYVKFLTA